MEKVPSAPAGGDQDNGPAMLAVCLSSLIVAINCVCLRCYIRMRITRSFWWDDGFIVLAAALSVAGAAFNILSVHSGAGRHSHYLHDPETQVPDIIKWNTAYQINNINSTLAIIMWTVMAIMPIVNLITATALAAQCRPLQKLWQPNLPGVCFYKGELSQFGYAQAIFNVLTDLLDFQRCSIESTKVPAYAYMEASSAYRAFATYICWR
ncbi:hypothetical protein G7Y89_g13233 [Cudoniella acicularis]|uniref:Rhodopsin domain-containing protein n=1 Tax=Cudoniella acicularis TaxID=354080 RepID=A0A8H4R8N1_9HELO|nr:hypothetical protein G7Y89_g13233 [Cudoniella acicularis]